MTSWEGPFEDEGPDIGSGDGCPTEAELVRARKIQRVVRKVKGRDELAVHCTPVNELSGKGSPGHAPTRTSPHVGPVYVD